MQPLPLCVLKITEFPEIAPNEKFFFAVADTNKFSIE